MRSFAAISGLIHRGSEKAKEQKHLDRLLHPKSVLEALLNLCEEYVKATKALESQKGVREKLEKMLNVTPGKLILAASKHSYYDGDPRGVQANTV